MATKTNINSVISASITKRSGWGGPVTYGPFTFIGKVTKIGSSNPRYKRDIEAGANATTPYSVFAETYNHSTGYMVGGLTSNPQLWTSEEGGIALYAASVLGFNQPSPWYSVYSSKAYNESLGSFLGMISTAQAPFKGLVFMGEIRETLSMIRGAGKSLFKGMTSYLQQVRRLRRMPRRQKAKEISNIYLQYIYGWQPLLADIESASEAYKRAAVSKDRIPVWSSAKEQDNASASYSDLNLGAYIHWTIVRSQRSFLRSRFVGAVDWQRASEGLSYAERLIRLSGFSFNEFVPTLWELLPYSFVVDYFTNIGAILTAACTNTSNVAWYSCTQKVDLTSVISVQPRNWYAAGSFVNGSGGTASYRSFKMDRSIPPLQIPSLQVFLPGLGSQKWLNLSALVGQRVL